MRLVTVRTDTGTRAGRVDGDDVTLLDATDVGALLAAGDASAMAADGPTVPRAEADLAPVVTRPGKVICVGLNYRPHIQEMGHAMPDHPTYFTKYANALIGARDDIALPSPSVSTHIDWEGELLVVIGAPARHVSGAEALACIGGFSVANDVSVRDWQRRTSQFLAGKAFEGLSPIGPELVTADEVGDGTGLELTTTVDGVVKQQANTSDLVHQPVDLITDLSTITTLDPGDIILTGTPGGVGAARTPPEWLAPGRRVEVSISGLGRLDNLCRQG